jgi:hypothetical protein
MVAVCGCGMDWVRLRLELGADMGGREVRCSDERGRRRGGWEVTLLEGKEK